MSFSERIMVQSEDKRSANFSERIIAQSEVHKFSERIMVQSGRTRGSIKVFLTQRVLDVP